MYDLSTNTVMNLPSFQDIGFSIKDNILSTLWDDETHIKSVQKHVDWLLRGCKCKKGCIKNTCKCKKSNNECGPGCSCMNCKHCSNNYVSKTLEIELEEAALFIQDENDDSDAESIATK